MRKLLGIALVGVLAAAGCKDSSSSTKTQASSTDPSDTTSNNAGKGRSGRIDLRTPQRPSLPDDTGGDDADAPRERQRPSLEDREARRHERMSQLDTDGDGKISDQERAAARHKRAEDLLSRSDINGDGKVTPDELAQGRFRRMKPEELDTNKDGSISVDELDAALEQRARMWGGGRFGRFGRRFGGGGAPAGAGSGAQP